VISAAADSSQVLLPLLLPLSPSWPLSVVLVTVEEVCRRYDAVLVMATVLEAAAAAAAVLLLLLAAVLQNDQGQLGLALLLRLLLRVVVP
jgi:hypothetical protein